MAISYRRLCPACYGRIPDERLSKGLLCDKCDPEGTHEFPAVCDILKDKKFISSYCMASLSLKKFEDFFESKIGALPWGLQKIWAKRIFLGESFALVAPTGVGKTTFGVLMAVFLDGRSYIIVPTRLLVLSIKERFSSLSIKKNILAYTGKKKEKERIRNMDFDILITTTNFLARNKDIFTGKFDFVFVDDVDSLLKSGRNVETVLKLIGISDKEIKIAEEVLKLKRKMVISEKMDLKDKRRLDYLKAQLDRLRKKRGILVVSSATLTPKTNKVKMFRELLGFDVGKIITTVRHIDDVAIYTPENILQEAASLIKKMQGGVFAYVSMDRGRKGVEEVVSYFRETGIKTISYEEFDEESKKAFEEGKIECVVGISSSRNPLVRGLDLPLAVKFAVFIGVPKIEFSVDIEKPSDLLGILIALRKLSPEKEREIDEIIAFFRRYPNLLRPDILEKYSGLKRKFEEGKELVRRLLQNEDILNKLRESDEVYLEKKGESLYIVVGDYVSYVQASGRTSRLYKGGITHGASFLLIDNPKAFMSLYRRLGYAGFDVDFKILKKDRGAELCKKYGFSCVDEQVIERLIKDVVVERERIKTSVNSKNSVDIPIKTALLIVESPNKARTIASFFGKPLKRMVYGIDVYEIPMGEYVLVITASKGHIFDLVVNEGVYGVIENDGMFLPVYDTIRICTVCNEQTTEDVCYGCKKRPDVDKIDIVKALRHLGYQVEKIFIATDPDTEGEKIASDINNTLRIFQKNIVRMEFHEVTRRAIVSSLYSPRGIDENLVKAQIIRRIADRWIGFSLTEKLREFFKEYNLSAGRVQTPVLGWIIERTEKSREKKNVLKIYTDKEILSFELEKRPDRLNLGEAKLQFKIKKVYEENGPVVSPFNTSSLLRESSSKLGFGANKTMQLAQDLFEAGLITYHRTDSVRVSPVGIELAKRYITTHFGSDLFKPREFSTSEGAHECIRPTQDRSVEEIKEMITVWNGFAGIKNDHLALYDLIFKRFIASQMKVPVFVEALVEFRLNTGTDVLISEEEKIIRIKERGYDYVYPVRVADFPEEAGFLTIKSWRILSVPVVYPFTQGELVEEMRKRGIGRPSTYAKIVETLLKRKYVIERNGKLYSTRKGKTVYEFLKEHFGELVSEELTRKIEELQDEVEKGTRSFYEVMLAVRDWRERIEKVKIFSV